MNTKHSSLVFTCIIFIILYSGYRDAQCGWLVVSDPSEINRRAQCLCIYASRRGILEVMLCL